MESRRPRATVGCAGRVFLGPLVGLRRLFSRLDGRGRRFGSLPDEYGRVKLQFHWDRDSPGDESSSCWVRVAQLWAGSNFGGIHIPRIGQEVIVEFLEGDPDQPIVTGRVYNDGHPSRREAAGVGREDVRTEGDAITRARAIRLN